MNDESDLKALWAASNIFPLWENRAAHRAPGSADAAHLWAWDTVSACIRQAIDIRDLAAVERRVLMLVGPHAAAVGGAAGTTTNLNANIQILTPGETARPHRHSINALRFVLEGEDAVTIVDGRECMMARGDLVTTPGWCWHEHKHLGRDPIIWLDVLDASLHRYLGTAAFQPGPPNIPLPLTPGSAYASAGFLPDGIEEPTSSPMFRYPWEAARDAVAAAPLGRDGARRIRYVNPVSGGPCTAFLDCYLTEIAPGTPTRPFKTSANSVCTVAEGAGVSRIGESVLAWKVNDIFSIPQGNWISHEAIGENARLFIVTDREVYKRLGLLTEEFSAAESG
jgi:gentisate 1,2-dioxygenase